jgi:hypothetical protein
MRVLLAAGRACGVRATLIERTKHPNLHAYAQAPFSSFAVFSLRLCAFA